MRKIFRHFMGLREIRDIIVSALALALVFSYDGIGNLQALWDFPVFLLVVSVGFVLHELAHRFVARKYECRAEYRMWKEGLLLAVAITLLSSGSFVFAAPGAVMIYPRADLWGNIKELSRRRFGLISISGPLTNIAIAAAFFAADMLYPSAVLLLAVRINIWLALFNMIPIPPLDGSKVFSWSRKAWLLAFLAIAASFLKTSGF